MLHRLLSPASLSISSIALSFGLFFTVDWLSGNELRTTFVPNEENRLTIDAGPMPIYRLEKPIIVRGRRQKPVDDFTRDWRKREPHASLLSNQAFAQAIKRWPATKRCAMRAGASDHGPEAMRIHLDIKSNGHVASAHADDAEETRERVMFACLKGSLSSLRFPVLERSEERSAMFVF